MQRRARQKGLASHPDAHLAHTLYSYRATDERIARAFGKRLPGRLCVLDDRLPTDESPAVLVEALLRAMHISNHYQTSMQRAILQWRQGQVCL